MTLGQRLRTTTALHAVAALALIAAPLPAAAQLAPNARPTGGQVTAGQASIGQSTTTTTVSQSSQRAAVNWQSFDVGSQQTVQFNQPSSSAVTLNRVVGPNPSEIAGHIQANGQLVVVNQAGVVFDKGSQVNAAGLVVSAAGISDGNFMAGKMAFDQAANPNARIENHGTITVKDHGLAALVAPQVRNSGTIQARMGTVILAGAEAETLDLYGDGLVTINVTKQVQSAPDGTKALVTNTGTIAAKGGSVVLTADAVDGVVQTLVDAGGHISADSTAVRTGRVLISGSGGDVRVEGVVTAQGSAPGLAGGSVQVSGSNATIVGAHARISASGQAGGGTVALGTTLARAQGNGTGIAAATTKTLVVRKGATISADATAKGGGGRVVLLSSDSTTMAGAISAKGGTQGGDGGFVEISGGRLTLTGHVDASAPLGNTGTLLLDPLDLYVSDIKPASATSWVSPTVLEGENANISLSATDNLYVATSYNTANTLNLGSHRLTLTGGTGLTIDRGFTIDASHISLTTLAGTITLDGASGVAAGLITAPQLAALPDTGIAAPAVVMAGAGGIALGGAMLGSAGTPLDVLDLSSSGGGITQAAGGAVFTAKLQSTGGVAGGVDLAGTGNAIARLGAFSASTGLVLNDDIGNLTVVGTVDGGTHVTLTNTGALNIDAPLAATGTVSLTGDGIAQNSAGVITAGLLTGDAGGGAAHLGPAINHVAELGPFTATQGFGFSDTTPTLRVVGAVDGGLTVYLVNTGSLSIGAGLSASGVVSLIGDGITQTAGGIDAGVLIGDAGAGGASFGLAANHIAALGAFAATRGFSLTDDTATLRVAGTVDGGTHVTLTNTGALNIDAPITATGTVSLTADGIVADSAGVITANLLTGDAGAGAAALGPAINHVAELGAFTAAQGFGFSDDTPTLRVVGAIDGGPGVNIVNTGMLDIGAPITATGTVSLIGDGIALGSGGVITAGVLTGDAGSGAAHLGPAINHVAELGAFTAALGFGFSDDTPTLKVVGAVDGGLTVYLVNTGSVVIGAGLSASGVVSLIGDGITQTAGGIDAGVLIGDAGAGGATLGRSSNHIAALGAFAATQGFTLRDDTPTLLVAGTVAGGTHVTLTNTGALSIGAPVSATGTVSLTGDGIAQNSAGVITAGLLTGNAGGGAAALGPAINHVAELGPFTAAQGLGFSDDAPTLTVVSAVNGGPGVNIVNTGALDIDAALTATGTVSLIGDGIAQSAAGVINAGTLTGNAGSGAADLATAANRVTDLGPFTAATGFALNNATGTLTVIGAVNGGTSLSLANTGSLAIDARLTASGTVDLTGHGISQTAAGVIDAGTLEGNAGTGAAALGTAANRVADLGPFTAAHGFTLNDAVGTLTVAGTVAGGTSVYLVNTGSLSIDAAIGATGTVTLDANGITQTGNGIITAGTLTGNAGTGAVELGMAENRVGALGLFTAATGFDLNDGVAKLSVIGAVHGGPSVTLANTGSLAISAAVDATGLVTLDADGISQTASGIVTAGRLAGTAGAGAALLGNAANVVTDIGAFSAADGFTLNDAVGVLTVADTVNGGSSVHLTNTGALVIGAAVDATGLVALDADGISQTAAGIISAGTLTGDAGGGVAYLGAAANDIAKLGPFSATTGFTLNDTAPALTVVGAVEGGSFVTLTNTGNLTIDAAIGATHAVTLDANGIGQSAAGVITAATLTGSAGTGAAGLGTATNRVTTLGAFTATGGFTLKDNVGTLTVAGAVDGGTGVSLINTGSLVIDAGVSGTNTVSLTAVGISQNAAGIVTAGTLIGTAGSGAARLGAAANEVTDLGPFSAGAGFTLNDAAPALTIVGAIDGGPSVGITANGITQTAAGIITAGTLTGSAGSGAADLGTATNLVTDLGPFTATTGFTLKDHVGTLTVVGAVDGGTGVALTNTGSLVLDAGVSGTGTVALTASGISQDVAGIITAGTLTGTAGSGAAALGTAANAVTELGPFTADAGFTLKNDTPALTIVGAVDGGPSVTLTNTGSLAQTAAGIITAHTLSGSAGAGADFGTAANIVTDLGPFTAATGFTLNDSVGTLTVAGAVNGGTGVTLTNTGKLALDAAVSGTDSVALSANGITQTAAGIITTDTLSGSAGTGAAALGTATNLVADLGPLTATSGFTLKDNAGTLTVGGAVDGGTDVTLTNTGSLVINAGVSGTGTVALTAIGISQDAAGIISAGTLTGTAGSGAAALGTAANVVTALGPFTAGSGFTLNNATPALTIVGAIDGGPSVSLTNTGSLAIDAAIDPTNTVTLDANGITQTAAGIITAGTLTGSAGTGAADLGTATNLVTDLGPFTATTGFTLKDHVGTLTVVGAVDGGTGVTLTNTGSLVIDAGLSGTGTVALTAVGILQDAAGVITAGTLTGTAGSGAAQLDGAANAVSNLGPFTADAGFALNNATPALSVVGAIDGGPSVALANTGSLALDAAVGGTSTVALNANGITQTAAGVITTNSLSGSAGSGSADLGTATNVVTNLGPFTAATGFTLNDAVGTLTVAGAVNGGTGVSLANTGNLVLDAGVSGTDTVAMTAVGISQDAAGIVTAGTLTGTAGSGAAAFGTATNLVTNLGPFTAGAGFTLNNDTPALTVIGAVDGGPTLSLTNTGSLAIDAALGATGTVSLTANGIAQTGNGVITTRTLTGNAGSGDADLAAATNVIANLGPFAAAGAFQLLDGTDLTVIGNVTAGSDATVGVTGNGNNLVVNSGITVKSASATAALAASGGDITNNGSVVGGVLAALTAGHDLTQSGIVEAGGDAILTATGGALTQSGTVTAGNSAMLTAGTNLMQTGTVDAIGGSASLTAVGNLTQSKIVKAGADATLTATNGTLAQNGTVTAGGNATLTATNGSLNQAGIVTAGNAATLVAGADLSQTGTVDAIGGSASLTAVGNLTQSKIVKAGADATLTATNGTLAQNGTVTAGGNATLTAANGALNQAGTVIAGNNATLVAGTDLSQTGTVDAAGGSASLAAFDTLTQSTIVTAGTNATLTATNGTLIQNGTITAGGDATLIATNGALTQNGTVTAGNSATLTAGTNLLQAGTVIATAGNASLVAAGALTQSSLVTAGTNATLTATTGTLTQNGTVTAGQSATLTAGADLLQTGTMNAANGNATLTASGNLTQADIVSAGGNASLTATNGTLAQSGTVTAGGSASLTAGLDLSQTGIVHANGGDATLTAARTLTQSGTVTATNNATLTADTGDLAQTGSITAGTSAILQATAANLSDSGTITAPNIQLAARNGTVSFSGTFAGVQPDPSLDPQHKLKQGAFPTNLSIGAWISGSTITVAPTALVTGAGGGLSQLVIALTSPTGTVTFGNFNNPKTQLYLGLGTGFAAGQIEVDTLQVQYVPPGTLQTINLSGTVSGQGGSTAASASFIQPLTKENYQVNGCPIESTSCIQITTLSLPTINPLKDLEVSTPVQADDILIILPDVGDRDY